MVTSLNSSEDTSKLHWKAAFRRYINYTPSDAQKEEFASWADDTNLYDLLEFHAKLGRQISVSYDLRNSCYQATCFERAEESVNAGYIATGRGGTPATALLRLLWYVTEIFPDDWNELISPTIKDLW